MSSLGGLWGPSNLWECYQTLDLVFTVISSYLSFVHILLPPSVLFFSTLFCLLLAFLLFFCALFHTTLCSLLPVSPSPPWLRLQFYLSTLLLDSSKSPKYLLYINNVCYSAEPTHTKWASLSFGKLTIVLQISVPSFPLDESVLASLLSHNFLFPFCPFLLSVSSLYLAALSLKMPLNSIKKLFHILQSWLSWKSHCIWYKCI